MTKKQTTILLTSFILIFMFCIFYVLIIKTISISEIANRFQENNNTLSPADFMEIDYVLNKAIFVELGLFALFQFLGFAMYLQKNAKVLNVLLLVNVILTVIEIIIYSNPEYIVFMLPAVNIGLYLYGLKDEEEKQEKKTEKTKKKVKKSNKNPLV